MCRHHEMEEELIWLRERVLHETSVDDVTHCAACRAGNGGGPEVMECFKSEPVNNRGDQTHNSSKNAGRHTEEFTPTILIHGEKGQCRQ